MADLRETRIAVSWAEIVLTRDGVTLLDGEVVGTTNGFAQAVERVASSAAAGGKPLLVRAVDHTSPAEPMWFTVDEAGQRTGADGPASDCGAVLNEDDRRRIVFPEDPGLVRSRRSLRRPLVVAAAVIVGIAVLLAGVWVVFSGIQTPATPRPVVSPAASAVEVTLPGFAVEPAWTTSGVSGAAVAGSRVISVSGATVSVADASTGTVAATADLPSDSLTVLSGTVGGVPALAAVSDEEALVWVGESVEPLTVDLSGARWLVTRTGAFVVIGTDYAFEVVTATGTVPVVSPRPEMVVLGVAGDAVIWAGAPRQVIVAATNGTPVREVTLVPPSEGAVITPKVGWVRAATEVTIVVGWTAPDGSTITGVHSAETGDLSGEIPGPGTGVLHPDGVYWVVDGHGVELDTATTSPLPDRFTASQFLGGVLYGALPSGTNAILRSGDTSPVEIDAPTARPLGEASETLLTLTNGLLAGFPATK